MAGLKTVEQIRQEQELLKNRQATARYNQGLANIEANPEIRPKGMIENVGGLALLGLNKLNNFGNAVNAGAKGLANLAYTNDSSGNALGSPFPNAPPPLAFAAPAAKPAETQTAPPDFSGLSRQPTIENLGNGQTRLSLSPYDRALVAQENAKHKTDPAVIAAEKQWQEMGINKNQVIQLNNKPAPIFGSSAEAEDYNQQKFTEKRLEKLKIDAEESQLKALAQSAKNTLPKLYETGDGRDVLLTPAQFMALNARKLLDPGSTTSSSGSSSNSERYDAKGNYLGGDVSSNSSETTTRQGNLAGWNDQLPSFQNYQPVFQPEKTKTGLVKPDVAKEWLPIENEDGTKDWINPITKQRASELASNGKSNAGEKQYSAAQLQQMLESQLTPERKNEVIKAAEQRGYAYINGRIVEKRELGGDIIPGQPYLVGEKGPEMIVPQQNGLVIPNNFLPSLGGMMGNVSQNIQKYATGASSGLGGLVPTNDGMVSRNIKKYTGI